ncbi:hypothetical protein GRF29_96g78560 [Pseudopithomyces chartarum]|uniref:Uncharacterized protein n=1 Tax=Pseudopithomyces chartarum TaxID=1892770 RepID=A0AAN6LWU7_9PLEO|nr:hypothetical protein GRF29_96g78560 [Pseudopithomyces chartarum]
MTATVLDYAVRRANSPEYIQEDGTLLQDLVGAPSERDQETLVHVASSFQAALSATGSAEDNGIGVIIHCNDNHLRYPTSGFSGVYFDTSEGRQAQVRMNRGPAPGRTGPCGDNLRAFAYPYSRSDGMSGAAIVLCSIGAGSAFESSDKAGEVSLWRKQGNLSQSPEGLNTLGRYLSYMIIHELMHAIPASLPDSKAEIYGYVAIAGHNIGEVGGNPPSRNDRLHNADSFAFLAMAWYMNKYKFINGKAVWIPAKNNPPPDNL